MGQNSQLKSPKKEEQLVPSSIVHGLYGDNTVIMDDFEGIFSIKDEEELGEGTCNMFDNDELNWDFMDCEEFSFNEDAETYVDDKVKGEENNCWLWGEEDEDAKKMSLNLSLNYQDVIDSWSSERPLWAEDCSLSPHSNNGYMGEVPVMEEDRSRREASVLRYKEKRQNRLFAKKIRYEVRKLNADKRPRLKGRFVKRNP